jgi:hypothetical protein
MTDHVKGDPRTTTEKEDSHKVEQDHGVIQAIASKKARVLPRHFLGACCITCREFSNEEYEGRNLRC